MSTVNSVTLIGNLGADPEIRTTPAGKKVAEVRLATSYKYGETEQTEWHRVVLWEKLADVVEAYTRKGTKIYVQGRIQTRSWDKEDGSGKGYITEIIAEKLTLLSPRPAEDDKAEAPAPKPGKPARKPRKAAPVVADADDDDLPF